MVLDNLVRAAAILLVPLLHVLGALALWHLYVIAALFGLLMMIPLAGTPTLIPSLVPVERRQTANALEVLGYTVGGISGPMLGGALIAGWGAPLAVLLSGAIYLFFAWTLARLPPQPPAGAASRRAPLGEAIRLLVGNAFLISTTLMFLVSTSGWDCCWSGCRCSPTRAWPAAPPTMGCCWPLSPRDRWRRRSPSAA